MTTTERRPGSPYLLELAAAGELPEEERRRVLDAAPRPADGGDPLADLARDAAHTLARHPPERVAAEVTRRAAAAPRRRRWSFVVPVLATVAAALVAAVAVPRRAPAPLAATEDGVRVKGLAPHLVVHRRTASGAELVAPGTPVRPGDLVQLGYVSAGRPYGAIVSLDGAGSVTRHWPVDGPGAAALEAGREVVLPEAFRLDAAPRFERFFLVTSDRQFEVAPVLEAARALGARPDARDARLPLPADLADTDVLLQKEIR